MTQNSTESHHDIIAGNIELLKTQLAAGHSDSLKAYLAAMGRFHSYSFGNILEIARQRPSASRVAGFQAWKKLGRTVNKGEKGIRILAPITFISRSPKIDGESASSAPLETPPVGSGGTTKTSLAGFRNVYVFDQSQTSGEDLPALDSRATGEVGPLLSRLTQFLESKGISVEYSEGIAPALGLSYGGRIVIYPNQSEAELFATLVHEAAHLCCVRNYVA